MRKILSFAALALSSGAAVISAGGAAHASSSAHDWCAAPVHAQKVDAACITNHSTIHVGLHDVDVDSNWCLGAFAAFGDVIASPALSCEDHGKAHHVPGPPPMGDHDCDDVCGPHMPPPPPPVPCPPPHPCPPPGP
ncbi:MAG: hypothetical protein HOV87_13235, partial [Catenulispora sp.]|nr:hypothetical protein [Catenulispora sp.]